MTDGETFVIWFLDLPAHEGTFRRRYAAMLSLRVASDNAYWQVVEQLPIESAEALEKKYAEVLAAGGEGIMLRRIESPHRGGRSNDLLKYNRLTMPRRLLSDTIRVKVNTSAWSVHCG